MDTTNPQLGSRQPPLSDQRIREGSGPQASTAQGAPGMLGSAGSISPGGLPQTGGPIGVPTDEGGEASSGSEIPPGTQESTRSAKPSDVLGTPGNVGRSSRADMELGIPDIPGTPVPGPLAGDPTPPKMPNGVRSGEAGADNIEHGAGIGVMTGGTEMGTGGTIGAKGVGASQTEVNDHETDSGSGITHANLADGDAEQ